MHSSSLVDFGTECLNNTLNWTCPGGYIQVQKAEWETHSDCGKVTTYESYLVTTHLQNICNNKTTCDFTATDSSFGVTCTYTCTKFDYGYTCISKSFVLCFLLIIFFSN